MLYEEEFQALNAAGIRYVVVGGFATVLHGYARMTIDLDLIVELTTNSTSRAIEVLTALGYQPRHPVPAQAFADEKEREIWAEDRNMIVFSLYKPDDPRRVIDLFVRYPLPVEQLFDNACRMQLGPVEIPVIGLDELIQMKQAAGRSKDIDDVKHLAALRDTRDESEKD